MRRTIALALLIVALTAGAAWLVARLAPPPPPPRPAAGPIEPASASGPAAARAVDPAEQARLESLREAREHYVALRDAWPEGHPTPVEAARLQAVLVRLWPAPGQVVASCRGAICRVLPTPAPPGWQAALAEHDGIRALAEQVAVDPDASTTPAYVLLAPPREVAPPEAPPRELPPPPPPQEPEPREPPPPGRPEEYLRGVEATVRASPELAACLATAEPGPPVEVRLVLGEAGLSYRLGPGLAPPPAHCAAAALEALTAAPVPAGLAPAERTLQLERGPESP